MVMGKVKEERIDHKPIFVRFTMIIKGYGDNELSENASM